MSVMLEYMEWCLFNKMKETKGKAIKLIINKIHTRMNIIKNI